MFYLNSTLNFGILPVLEFQLEGGGSMPAIGQNQTLSLVKSMSWELRLSKKDAASKLISPFLNEINRQHTFRGSLTIKHLVNRVFFFLFPWSHAHIERVYRCYHQPMRLLNFWKLSNNSWQIVVNLNNTIPKFFYSTLVEW